MVAAPLFVVFLLTRLVLLSGAETDQGHAGARNCPPLRCGKLGDIQFPYTNTTQGWPPSCGGLYALNCSQQDNPKIQLKEGGHWYEVVNISQADSITINDNKLQKDVESRRCESLESFGLPKPNLITNVSSPYIVSLFKCKRTSRLDHNITSPTSDFLNTSCGEYNLYYSTPTPVTATHPLLDGTSFPNFQQDDDCSFIQLPAAPHTGNSNDFCSFFTADFSLQLHVNYACLPCRNETHRCLFDDKNHSYHCAPKETPEEIGSAAPIEKPEEIGSAAPIETPEEIGSTAPIGYGKSGKSGKLGKLMLGLAMATVCAGLIAMVVLICCLMRKFTSMDKFIFFWKKPNEAHQNVEVFLRLHGPGLPARRYSYLDVKKMTNSFTNKIGQGGYGCVYKGKLKNGGSVAVKVLDKSKGNGEEFINEVATIGRTSHVNIVALLGFCFEGSKRALIYEFMPNGSLEKFIFKENHNQKENHHQLEWGTLYRISLGIARGLEYLHRGCNTRILHFDIKPHNILLDKDFSPKISDFGLAKVCNRQESIISTLQARGTIGYIAPEVFCRSFGAVSHKSDVYSYGMMVLEMVGGRKNVNVGADHTSEIYFPHWIYKRLELDDELGLKRIINQEDNAKVRKMVIIGLWCIQTDPSNRPTMSKVIEMLEGSVDSLQVPPKPFLSSPSRSPTDSSNPMSTSSGACPLLGLDWT